MCENNNNGDFPILAELFLYSQAALIIGFRVNFWHSLLVFPVATPNKQESTP